MEENKYKRRLELSDMQKGQWEKISQILVKRSKKVKWLEKMQMWWNIEKKEKQDELAVPGDSWFLLTQGKFVDIWKKKLPNKLILKGRAKHFQKQKVSKLPLAQDPFWILKLSYSNLLRGSLN